MKIEQEFDTVVIGSGPGGEGASIRIAKEGRSVAIIEQQTEVGGACTHLGTIPSKALIYMTQQLVEARHNFLYRAAGICPRFSLAELMQSVDDVVARQVRERQGFYDRNAIRVISGRARFVDAQTVEAVDEQQRSRFFRARHFVVATGSVPYRPSDLDFSHPRIVDSDTVLQLKELPHTLTLLGAGVIGCEYASVFRHLGAKVNLINLGERILPYMDEEIAEALSYHLREEGVIVRNHETYDRVEPRDDCVVSYLKSGKEIKSDLFFWAAGRSGNSRNIGLEELGVEINQRGHIQVNEDFQTSVPHIYAVGDVIGPPSLSSASYDQGLLAGTHIVFGRQVYKLNEHIPTGIYTIPEIGSVGRTEKQLTQACVPYEVGHAFFRNLARSQINGHMTGMLKILFHSQTMEILGVHCFGHQAAELVHIGQSIMSQPGEGNNLLYFINTTLNYPTMAEAYRVAALNGLNRLANR